MKLSVKEVKKMKKNKYMLFGVCVIAMFALVMFATPVLADVGNYNDYSSTSSSSSSSSSGDGSIFDLFILIYVVYDIFGPVFGTIILIGFIVLLGFAGKKEMNKKRNKSNVSLTSIGDMKFSDITSVDSVFEDVSEKVTKIDPNFSESNFITFANDVFVKIQTAWSKRDWKVIRPFESNELFSVHNMQLQEYIDNKKINKIEKIALLNTMLLDFSQEGGKDVLVVRLTARFKDYVVDEVTNKVLESDPNTLWTLTYDMTFTRTTGVLTKINQKKSTTNCPNCGAPTEITSAGMCEYCNSVITTGNHDWVLSDYKRSS